MIPSWIAKIVCPRQDDDVCPFRSTDIVARLERIEAQQTALAESLHDHMRQETTDFGSVLSEVRELITLSRGLIHG